MIITQRHILPIVLLLGLAMLLSACGFHLRGANTLSPPLRTVYLSYGNQTAISSDFDAKLRDMLAAYSVKVVSNAQKTPIILSIDSIHEHSHHPTPSSGSGTVTITYTLKLALSLRQSSTHKLISQRHFTASRSTIISATQLYASNAINRAKAAAERDMLSRIYDWLAAKKTKQAITHASHAQTAH